MILCSTTTLIELLAKMPEIPTLCLDLLYLFDILPLLPLSLFTHGLVASGLWELRLVGIGASWVL